jgi:hypothetical protein
VDVFTVPASILREIDIVDTPGTNAINREHEALTQEFIPRSDMVLFVTSVDRPFTKASGRSGTHPPVGEESCGSVKQD